tara:strand:- start:589 stop:810 length:222 start_codon:yes stop_codon:yes gene_type:complete
MKLTKTTLKRLIKEELKSLNESLSSGEMAVMGIVQNVFRNAGMTDDDLLEELAFEVAETVGKDYDIVQKLGRD